mmetsp:Transcript_6756/g.11338  ORF Transcript_6756/g.11338 Transcript_6756/m.11338 type:complete len:135 (-) Transcript_6756:61-465(-)
MVIAICFGSLLLLLLSMLFFIRSKNKRGATSNDSMTFRSMNYSTRKSLNHPNSLSRQKKERSLTINESIEEHVSDSYVPTLLYSESSALNQSPLMFKASPEKSLSKDLDLKRAAGSFDAGDQRGDLNRLSFPAG